MIPYPMYNRYIACMAFTNLMDETCGSCWEKYLDHIIKTHITNTFEHREFL